MIRLNRPDTLNEYLVEYGLTREICAEALRQYQIAVDLFDGWRSEQGLGERVRLDELNELEISAWLRDYSASGRAPATVRSKRVSIVSLWRNAADEGYVDPPKRRIRSQKVILSPVCWDSSEVVRLLNACSLLKRTHRCGLPRRLWWELAVRVAWDSGLRKGDLFNLRVDQIPESGLFGIIQSKTKRLQVCRLDEPTLELMHKTLKLCPRELVCPWPASHETFSEQVKRLVCLAGVRPGSWKWLRRASGTDVEVQQLGAAARQLGHRPGSAVTYQSYVDPVIVATAAKNIVWPTSLPRDTELPGGEKKVF
jgi:integrase